MSNVVKRPKKRLNWVDIAKGIAIILMVLGHEVGNRSIYALIFSFHMPLFFILSGYTSGAVLTWAKFRKKFRSTFIKVWLLAVLMVFLLGVENLIFSAHEKFPQFISSSLLGVLWGSNIPARGIMNVGVMWFMFVFFWAKLFFDFLQVIFPNKYNGVLLGILSYLMCIVTGNQLHWLPQALDVVPIAALFMWCGHVLKIVFEKFISQREHFEQVTVAVAFVYWIAMVQSNVYIELSVRHYPYFIFSFIEAIAGTIVIDYLSKCFSLNKGLASLKYVGRHTLAVLCIHHLDLYWVIWGGWIKSWPLAALTRLAVDLCILLIVIQVEKLIKKRRLARAHTVLKAE